MASFKYTFASGDTLTPARLNDARDVFDIVNADIKSDAAIAGTKIVPAFGAQDITVSTANRSITNTGNFSLSFGTNNTERVRIAAAGNVGIGTASPATPLHVSGTSAFGILSVSSTSANAEASMAFFDSGDTNEEKWVIGKNLAGITSDAFSFYRNGNLVVIDTAGNVGMGTSTPASYVNSRTLTIYGSSGGGSTHGISSLDRSELYHTATESYLKSVSSVPLWFGTDNAERMRITTAGNVGIGASNPVSYVDATTLTIYGLFSGISTYGINNGNRSEIGHNNSESYLKSVSGQPLWFGTDNAERMRITAAGDVGIGTGASPASRLHVVGDLTLGSATTAASATAGAETLPANPVGFLVVSINGTSRKIPYYAT